MLSTILIIVFALLFALALFGALAGFIKGLFKTGLKTVIKVILVVIFLFTSAAIANGVANIDFSNFNVSFNFNNQTIHLTTVQMTIANIITSTGIISPINGISAYQTAIAITNSLIAYVVFFLCLLLIQLFISLITAIFYNGIFRWFAPVETNKERKARKSGKKNAEVSSGLATASDTERVRKKLPMLKLGGALLGGVQEFVFACLLISPFTALARTAVNNKDNIISVMNDMNMGADNVKTVSDSMDTVSQSMVYKLLGINNIDTSIMNTVSKVEINGTEVSFNNLIDSVFDVASPLLSSNAISYNTATNSITFNFSVILTSATIGSLIDSVLANKTILALIPPLVDVALNLASNGDLPVENLDFTDIRWTDELTAVKDIYAEIGEDLAMTIVNEDGVSITPTNFKIDVTSMNDTDFDAILAKYNTALSKLGSMNVIKKNMASILSGMGTLLNGQGIDLLSTDVNSYSDINWSEDFPIIVSSCLRLFRTIGMNITADFKTENMTDKLVSALSDKTKSAALSDIICGTSAKSGLLDAGIFSIESTNTEHTSPIVLSKLLSSSLSLIPSLKTYVSNIEFSSTLDSLTQEELKQEFRTILQVAGVLYNPDNPIKMDNLAGIDFTNEAVSTEILEILETAEDSKVFSKLFPTIMRSFLFNTDMNFEDFLFGLTPYDFNYESDTFINDFRSVLEVLPSVMTMTNAFRDTTKTNAEKINAIDTKSIKTVLTTLTSSAFFNPSQALTSTDSKKKNANIQLFLSNLFSNEPFLSIGFTCPDIETFSNIDFASEGGEIDKICQVIDHAKKNVDFLVSAGDVSLSNITDVDEFISMAKSGIDSEILSPSILSIIDDSLNEYLGQMGIPLSLNEMRTSLWKEDLDELGTIIRILQDLGDLNDIDITTLSPNMLNALLTAIYKTNFLTIGSKAKDPFGYALYCLFQKQGLFDKLSFANASSSIFQINEGSSWSGKTDDEGYTLTSGTKVPVTVLDASGQGEIKYICNLFNVLQTIGFDSFTGGTLPLTTATIQTLKTDCLGSYFIRSFLSEMLSSLNISSSLGSTFSSLFDYIDFSALKNMSAEQFANELEFLTYIDNLSNANTGDGTSKLTKMFSDIFNIKTNGLEEEFNILFEKIEKSVLLTTVKDGYLYCPLAKLLSDTLNDAGLVAKTVLSGSTDSVLNQYQLDGILKAVTSDDWMAENGEVDKLHDVIIDLQGLDLTKLSLVDGMSKDICTALLTTMNSSKVFHRFPISIFKEDLTLYNFTGMLKDPETGVVTHPLVFDTHLSTSEEDIKYWENDYVKLMTVFYGDGVEGSNMKNGLAGILTGGKTLADITFDDISTRYLYYIGTTNLFHDSRSYLFYNIMKTSAGTYDLSRLFQTASSAPYGYNKSVYRLEELFYSNPKLLDASDNLDESLAIADLDMLQNALSFILTNMKNIQDANSLASLLAVGLNFSSLTNYAFTYKDNATAPYRSDLTSEIVAGSIHEMKNNAHLSTYFSFISDLDFYASDHKLVNPIEGKGLDGILAFASLAEKLGPSKLYFTKAEMIASNGFALFGSDPVANEDLIDNTYSYLCYHDYQEAYGNSKVGLRASAIAFNLTMMDSSISPILPSTLNQIITAHSINSDSSARSFKTIFADICAVTTLS